MILGSVPRIMLRQAQHDTEFFYLTFRMSLLSIKNLSISFSNHQVVSNFSLQLQPQKITALIGQSGSGKSLTALAIIGLVRKAKISGEILWTPHLLRGPRTCSN
jgi:ABC-type glutathione transport system ATPase component